MVGIVVALVTLLLMVVLTAWLWRVPAGPECPRCGRPVQEDAGGGRGVVGRLAIPVECPVCGWRGRMRRQPAAAERAQGRRGGRS
ncbi:MAG TPA: hypothetical protein VF832_03415 [Longimicrobiales bacterium]